MTENFIDAPAAVVSGWPAYALARVLRRHLPELLDVLDPGLRRPIEEALEALTLAGEAYARSRPGTAEPARVSAPVGSTEMEESLTTLTAAAALDCSDRYVRRLAAAGALPAHRDRKGWHVDAAAVHELQRQRGARC